MSSTSLEPDLIFLLLLQPDQHAKHSTKLRCSQILSGLQTCEIVKPFPSHKASVLSLRFTSLTAGLLLTYPANTKPHHSSDRKLIARTSRILSATCSLPETDNTLRHVVDFSKSSDSNPSQSELVLVFP